MNAKTNDNLRSMFLPRRQYDYLIQNCPAWMASRWMHFTKMWAIGGVTVTAASHEIENLRRQLPMPEDC